MHFWQVVTLRLGGAASPENQGFIGAMPEFMMSRLPSPCGTSGKLRSRRWPLLSKNLRNSSLI
jgi:hypothetical protein